MILRILWPAIVLSLFVISTVAGADTDQSTEPQHRRPPSSSSFLTRFIPKPHVNLLPLASLLGLTTSPLGMASMQQGVDSTGFTGGTYFGRGWEELTLMTFNVRYDNPLARRKPLIPSPNSDTTFPIQTFGEVSWSTRRHFIADTILLHNPDIFIFQEVLHNQLQDLVYLLGDEYAYVGVGRNDGHTKGEAVPVFWRRDKLRLRNQENGGVGQFGWTHFWLSEQPDVVGSVGWDADQTRMCTHVALEFIPSRSSGSSNDDINANSPTPPTPPPPLPLPIHIFSTHYDHLGHVARAKSSELILKRANETRTQVKKTLNDNQAEPLILLGGDLNSPRHETGWQNLVRGHHGIATANDDNINSDSVSFIDLQLAVPTRFGLPFPTDDFQQKPELLRVDGESVPNAQRHQKPFEVSAPASTPEQSKSETNTQQHNSQRGVLSTLYGPAASFTDWNPGPRTRPPSEDRIDFWFMGDNVHSKASSSTSSSSSAWKIKTAGTLSNWNLLEGGWRGSDHRPVIVRLRYEPSE